MDGEEKKVPEIESHSETVIRAGEKDDAATEAAEKAAGVVTSEASEEAEKAADPAA